MHGAHTASASAVHAVRVNSTPVAHRVQFLQAVLEVAVQAESCVFPDGHVLHLSQTLSVDGVGGTPSNSPGVQRVVLAQTRSDVAVAGARSNCHSLHCVTGEQTRFDVRVGLTLSNFSCTRFRTISRKAGPWKFSSTSRECLSGKRILVQ